MGSPTGKQLQRIPAQDNLYFRRMTLSGDGKWCLSDPEHEAKMLPDARFVVATLRLWNLQRGKEARSFKLVKTRAQLIWELAWQYVDYFIEGKGGDSIRATAISHDGKWVAGGTDRHEVHLWDAATGKKAHVLGRSNNEMEFPAAFSRDGKWLATHTFTLARFRKGEIFPITGGLGRDNRQGKTPN